MNLKWKNLDYYKKLCSGSQQGTERKAQEEVMDDVEKEKAVMEIRGEGE